MRIRKDKSNYRASGILRKLTPMPETVKPRSKKDTKRWCKGKPGREHQYDIVKIDRFTWARSFVWIDWKCKNCGRRDYQSFKR